MNQKWQARFSDSLSGIIFGGARRNSRGPWRCAEELPRLLDLVAPSEARLT